MRTTLRLLTLICLVWCGLHIAEPAAAHGATPAQHAMVDAGHDDEGDADPAEPALHGGHHHCPVAPDQPRDAGCAKPNRTATALIAGRTIPLTSLTGPPLLRPPAA